MIPDLASCARCVAVDLLGMGNSELADGIKPTLPEQARMLTSPPIGQTGDSGAASTTRIKNKKGKFVDCGRDYSAEYLDELTGRSSGLSGEVQHFIANFVRQSRGCPSG